MRTFVTAAALAGALIAASAAIVPGPRAASAGDGLFEGQAVITALGPEASAMTYWLGEQDGWHVVTVVQFTIPQSDASTGNAGEDRGEAHAVVRFSSVLQPGQSQLISVPMTVGEPPESLRIARVGDLIHVERVPGV
jgi:hypothetical protein